MTLHLDQRTMSKQLSAYQSQTVETASPARLISLLFEGALRHTSLAREAIEEARIEVAHTHLLKAQAIVTELSASLNMKEGGEVAQRLAALYDYCTSQLVEANVRKSVEPLDSVTSVLTSLHESWSEMTKELFADS